MGLHTPEPDQTRETIVFAFDTPEQRTEMWEHIKGYVFKDDGLRVVAMSRDNEMRRVSLIEEAVERYCRDHYEMREAIGAIIECPDLSAWSWEKFENDEESK